MNKELSKVRSFRWQNKSLLTASNDTLRLPVFIVRLKLKLNHVIEKLSMLIHPKSCVKQVVQSGLFSSLQIEFFHTKEPNTKENSEEPIVLKKGHLVTIRNDDNYRLLSRKEILFLLSIRTSNFQSVAN